MADININNEIIDFFGSQKELAEQLGVSEGAVSLFFNRTGFPAFRACQIEALSKGRFKAVDIIKGNKFFFADGEEI